MHSWATIIRNARKDLGFKQDELADLIGYSRRAIQDWEAGKAEPPAYKRKVIMEMIRREQARQKFTVAEPTNDYAHRVSTKMGGEAAKNLIFLRVIRSKAGNGAENEKEPKYEVYTRSTLEKVTGRPAVGLAVGVIVGDSMTPDFIPGLRFVYDPNEKLSDSGAYVLSIEGDQVVKDVIRLQGGALLIHSRNPDHPDETLIPTEESGFYRSQLTELVVQLRIVGKVVAHLQAD